MEGVARKKGHFPSTGITGQVIKARKKKSPFFKPRMNANVNIVKKRSFLNLGGIPT